MQSPAMKKKFAEEREKLGISKAPATFEEWLKAKQLTEAKSVVGAIEAIEDAREVAKTLEKETPTTEETLPEPEVLKGEKKEQAPVLA